MSGKPLIERFQGPHGSSLIRQAMQEQQCIRFAAPIADLLIAAGEMTAYDEGGVLMQEGGSDKDIYFIIAGLVSVQVNDRQVALRAAGQHVGEMAMIEPTSLRSATVVALEDTVAVKVPEPGFTEIANQYPALWRRIAADLAGRSRASNKNLLHINERPVLLLASSVDDFSIADLIRTNFSHDKIIVRMWMRNAFAAGRDTFEELHQVVSTADFGVILCSDEILRSRNGQSGTVRDNMLLEVGMSNGVLGHARTILVSFKGNKADSSADALQVLSPDFSIGDKGLDEQVASLCSEIRNRVQYFGLR